MRRLLNACEDLRIRVITPVFALLLAAVLGFAIMAIINQKASAGTTITPKSASSAQISSGSVTIDAYSIEIKGGIWGAGGGGGGSKPSGTTASRGGGGGGGSYVEHNFGKSQTGGVMAVVAGSGGAGGSSSPTNGSNGDSSSLSFGGTTVVAGGGIGGGAANGGGTNGSGGAGGTASGGNISNLSGNTGDTAGGQNIFGGGGHSGKGGNAAGSGGSGGGSIDNSDNDGNAGGVPGGGGGGAMSKASNWPTNGSARVGGRGGDGQVSYISWQVVNASINVTSISANYGPHIGGNQVTITGSGFDGVNFTSVTFGGVNATNVDVVNDTINLTVPAHVMTGSNVSEWVDVVFNYKDSGNHFDWSTTMNGFYEYRKAAETYENECQDPSSGDWVNLEDYLYTAQGSTVNCRITLDGMFNGSISLRDDYWDTINPSLSGIFTSTDSRFSNGTFGLTYANTYNPNSQTLLYKYTAPTATVLESYYDDVNGDDLFWPLIDTTITGGNLTQLGDDVVLGLLAEEYYILPEQANDKYCVGCSSTFIISTRGAPYLGTITLADDLSNVGHGYNVQSGEFIVEGSVGNVVDLSTLEGVDTTFVYTPATYTSIPADGRIRLYGTSNPAITDAYIDIEVLDTGLIITGPSSLKRGETGAFTLEVLLGAAWPSGEVDLTDVFSTGGLAGGVFADTTNTPGLTNTFDSSNNSYTFIDDPNETYIRTFTYTLRNDITTPPAFDSYLINITGTMDDPESVAWTSVNVLADRVAIKCSPAHPDCTTGYVGESKDYSITPNGFLVGSGSVAGNVGGGTLSGGGSTSWSSSVPFTMSYTPATPGRKVLTATVTSSTSNPSIVNQSFPSTNSDALNDYIYVMANSMEMEGFEYLSHGQTGSYVLTMNGPFVGTIYLNDKLSDGNSAGGSFDNGGSCTFTLADYNPTSNTSACAFDYNPVTVSSDTVITISASKASDYNHTLADASVDVTVYPPLSITSISPDRGPSVGGTSITITGKGFLVAEYGQISSCDSADDPACTKVTLDIGGTPAVCTNLVVDNSTTIRCTTASHSPELVSATVENKLNTRTYSTKNDAFTYVETTLELSPSQAAGGVEIDISPISGDSFGTSNSIASVGTNNPDGYSLSIEMYDPDNPTNPTNQRLNNISGDYISPVGGNWSTPATLGVNEWGYAIDGVPRFAGNKFSAVPQFGPSTRQIIKTYNSATTALAGGVDNTNVIFGANVDYSLTPGEYTGYVLYTAVAIDP